MPRWVKVRQRDYGYSFSCSAEISVGLGSYDNMCLNFSNFSFLSLFIYLYKLNVVHVIRTNWLHPELYTNVDILSVIFVFYGISTISKYNVRKTDEFYPVLFHLLWYMIVIRYKTRQLNDSYVTRACSLGFFGRLSYVTRRFLWRVWRIRISFMVLIQDLVTTRILITIN